MNELKTSISHPLIVNEVQVPGTGGRIGMTLCPGRSDDQSIYGNHWRRDLAIDLEAIRALDPAMLITLNQPKEFKALGVADFEATVRASGLNWRHLPIPDGGVPGPDFEQAWREVGSVARDALRAGRLVVIHCRAGLGRTGTIAARLLVELGMPPKAAIAAVRAARPKTIETPEQERHVYEIVPIGKETSPRAKVFINERALRGSVKVGEDSFEVFLSPDRQKAEVYKLGSFRVDSLARAAEALTDALPGAQVHVSLAPPPAWILNEPLPNSVDPLARYTRTLKQALLALGVSANTVDQMDEGGMPSEFRGFLREAGRHAENLLAARTLIGRRYSGTSLPDLDGREHLAEEIMFTTRAIAFSTRDGMPVFDYVVASSLKYLESALRSFKADRT